MLFGTPIFLFLFLPLVLGIYYLLPKKFRNFFLLLASLFFYAWGEQKLVVLIIFSTVVDYIAGIIIDKGFRKTGLYLSVIFNISMLLYFKYAGFAFNNINKLLEILNVQSINLDSLLYVVLPIGISFYTFQTMSYTIDVYRGNVKANYNLIDFACYVTLFPQLIAGPIIKYKEVSSQLKDRLFSSAQFVDGIQRFVFGLAKKMIIANNCAFLADAIFLLPNSELNIFTAWLGVIAFTIQVYFDFSGYSDMAIGLGKMFGFDFQENFNYPYVARSIQEFWRRWHISLSSWFKDYVYIPLGGSRLSEGRTYLNLIIVFFITGLWHGAEWTYVIWGLTHGVFMLMEKAFLGKFLSKHKVFSHMYMILVLLISFPIFRCKSLVDAWSYIGKMFSLDNNTNLEYISFYFTTEVKLALLFGVFFSMPIYLRFEKKLLLNYTLQKCFLIGVFLISIIYVSISTYNPFIYFRF